MLYNTNAINISHERDKRNMIINKINMTNINVNRYNDLLIENNDDIINLGTLPKLIYYLHYESKIDTKTLKSHKEKY